MKATIQKIIADISALPTPMNPIQVQKIFDAYPEFSSASSPTDMVHEWAQLGVVQKLAREGVKLSEKIRDLKLYEMEFLQYTERSIVLHKESQELDEYNLALQTEVNKSRAELTDLYNTFLSDVNAETLPEVSQFSSPETVTKKQAENIITFRKGVKEDIRLLTLPTIKMKLLELKEKQQGLLEELHNLSELYHLGLVIPRRENVNALQVMQGLLSTDLKKFILLKPQLEDLQRRFAERLSTKVAQQKIAELQEVQHLVNHELASIAQKMSHNPLSEDNKTKLTQEFQQSTNIELLIASYSSKIDSALAYLDPSSWLSWADNRSKYSEQQKEYHCTVDFLTLLHSRKEKQLVSTNCATQLEELTKISNASDSTDSEERQLTEEARVLLNTLPSCKIAKDFNPATSAANYYLVLIDNILLMPQKIKHYAATIAIIELLIPLVTQLVKLRSEYNLSEEQDNLLPNIGELKQVIPSEELLEQKQQQLTMCDNYLAKLKNLTEHLQKRTEQTKTIQDKQKEILFNVQVLKIALEKKKELEKEFTLVAQIEIHEQRLAILKLDIAQKLTLLKSAMFTQESSEPKVDSIIDNGLTHNGQHLVVDLVTDSTVHSDALVSADQSGFNSTQLKTDEILSDKEAVHLGTNSITVEGAVNHNPEKKTVTAVNDPILEVITDAEQQNSLNTVSVVNDLYVQSTDNSMAQTAQAVATTAVGNNLNVLDVDKQQTSQTKTEQLAGSVTTTHADNEARTSKDNKQVTIQGNDTSHSPVPTGLVLEQLQQWHHFNLETLAKHPKDIFSWYQELYILAEQAVIQTPYCYQYSHLIRDIFFELQMKNDLTVLYAYRRMCPEPKANITSLLALKSNHPIVEEAYDLSSIPDLPAPLHNMQVHYKKLKTKHPVEAELLLQAMHSLYFVYQHNTQNSMPSIEPPLLTQDPRYIPLQRHRGFLKIWELIEDFYHFVVGTITGQARYEYTNKRCFFNTSSSELMEEACDFVNTLH